jgi:hypothetical protein
MKTASRQGRTAVGVLAREHEERVAVKDGEDLSLLGRFFRAMLLDLLKQPEKIRDIEKLDLVVGIDPNGHPDNALTATFSDGRAVLESGIVDPDIVLMCEPAVLMKLARMPAGPAALKFLRTHEGKDLIARVRSRELKIRGIAGHPLGMMKFARFLAP